MYFDFANILVFLIVALGFIALNLVIAWLLRPKGVKTPGKLAIYECGEPTIGQAWIRFDIRFYTVALMFVVFDVEIALLFPWAVIFRDLVANGQGWIAFLEAGTFIAVLMAGLFYVWARGDLDWTAPGLAAPDAPAHEAGVVAASSASNLSTVPGSSGLGGSALGGSGSSERERALTAVGGSHADRR